MPADLVPGMIAAAEWHEGRMAVWGRAVVIAQEKGNTVMARNARSRHEGHRLAAVALREKAVNADSPAMPEARAFEINGLLVAAWMIQNGVSDGKELPDLSGISLNDAIEATRIVAATPPKPNAQGGHTHTCHVAESRIPLLFAWAISAKLRPLKSPKPADERSFLLYYHDKECGPEIFNGPCAREAAVHHFNGKRTAWSVTLFEEIASG